MAATERGRDLSLDIRSEQLSLLIAQSSPTPVVSMTVTGVVAVILWPVQDHVVLLIWCACIFVTGMFRIRYFEDYRRHPPSLPEVSARERIYLLTLFAYFLTWGLGGVWLMPRESPVHQVTVMFFLMAMAGSAVSVFSANRLALLGAVSALLVPASIWFYSRGDFLSFGLALAGTAFVISAARSSKVLTKTLLQNLILKPQFARGQNTGGKAQLGAHYSTGRSGARQPG